MRKPAFINVEMYIIETASPSNVITKLSISKISGRDAMGYDFEAGAKLGKADVKCGRELGKFLVDKAL